MKAEWEALQSGVEPDEPGGVLRAWLNYTSWREARQFGKRDLQPRAVRAWVRRRVNDRFSDIDATAIQKGGPLGPGFDSWISRYRHPSRAADTLRRLKADGIVSYDAEEVTIEAREVLIFALSDTILDSDYDTLVVRMQIKHPSLFDQYDRLRSEAELRYSLALPLLILTVASGITWSGWAVFLVLAPIALIAQANIQNRDAQRRVWQALVTDSIDSPAMERFTDYATRVQSPGTTNPPLSGRLTSAN